MATLMENVLSKPELVEAILLQLTIRDLLVNAPRVNKTFNIIISSSPAIKRRLFFTSELTTQPISSQRKRTPNSLLREAFPPWFENEPNDNWKMKNQYAFVNLNWNGSKQKIAAYARREASWRRMLLTQPPVMNMQIVKSQHKRYGNEQRTGMICADDGVRMGTFYDLVEEHMIRLSPVSSFGVRWHLDPGNDDAPHITVHLSHVVQCSLAIMGRGFRATNGRPKIEWVFGSEGYEDVPITFKEIPQPVNEAQDGSDAEETA